MGRRGRKKAFFESIAEATQEREAVELRWRDRWERAPELASLVTAAPKSREPFHRWLRFKQGFSSQLVREFLKDRIANESGLPVFDPFCGSGTCVIECARQGVAAIGLEASPALVFLSEMKFEREFPEWPTSTLASNWLEAADSLVLPIHRAALMIAFASMHNSEGRLNPSAPPFATALQATITLMGEDFRNPLPIRNTLHCGDARGLTMITDRSVGAVLTSPPYLSRHDYIRNLEPLETVYGHWYGERARSQRRLDQVVAHPRATPKALTDWKAPAAVEEASSALERMGEPRLARIVNAYFHDLTLVIQELCHVLQKKGRCWLVMGGARLKGVYVPTDTIVAEIAESLGFGVKAFRVARELVEPRRKFGRIGHVAPRESILVLQKKAAK